jgi:magnesium-transporting ATPase (P-type)
MCLGLCHTVVTDDKEKNGEKYKVYNASSPDELALVNGMRHLGFAFRDNDSDANMIIDHPRTGAESKYTLLHVIEFNSDRKRMSVIVRDENDRVLIICKGADSIIEKRLAPNQEHLTATKKHVDEYAEVGLRTLLIAYKYVEEDDYKKWLAKYTIAEQSTGDREKELGLVAEQIEVDFLLAGCSAIEDKLQENVGKTIADIKKAGIKVWVLTGDKVETAINIGQSC